MNATNFIDTLAVLGIYGGLFIFPLLPFIPFAIANTIRENREKAESDRVIREWGLK